MEIGSIHHNNIITKILKIHQSLNRRL